MIILIHAIDKITGNNYVAELMECPNKLGQKAKQIARQYCEEEEKNNPLLKGFRYEIVK